MVLDIVPIKHKRKRFKPPKPPLKDTVLYVLKVLFNCCYSIVESIFKGHSI